MEKLATRIVEKPWGRRGIDARFGVDADRQVGEIWFEPPQDRELDVMAKYLFTTERLSIQVHPDDAAARQRGYPRGKDECWVILDVANDAELGIGTRRNVEPDELLKAARDGEIEVAGPALAHSLTELGLIDEYRIYLHPVVLGRGTPYFAGPRPRLRLVTSDRIAEDVVRLTYAPA